MLRRTFIKVTSASFVLSSFLATKKAFAQTVPTISSFEAELVKLQDNPAELNLLRAAGPSEGQTFLRGILTHAITGRHKSDKKISDRAKELIITFEVTGEKHYNAGLQRLIWPYGPSGPTMGIGYDLGYVKPETLSEDWAAYIDAARIQKLSSGCQITGKKAQAYVKKHQDVSISWTEATNQFYNQMIPFLVGETLAALPKNAQDLSPDRLGAICSLVYNRGASFQNDGDRYAEMRNIRRLIAQGDFDPISSEIRHMKHIWEGNPKMAGLLTRRDLEADLFDLGR